MIASVSHFNPHARGKIDETSTYPMSFRFKRHTDIYYLEMLNVLCLFLIKTELLRGCYAQTALMSLGQSSASEIHRRPLLLHLRGILREYQRVTASKQENA